MNRTVRCYLRQYPSQDMTRAIQGWIHTLDLFREIHPLKKGQTETYTLTDKGKKVMEVTYTG
ncbi:MAG: hypothetical protein ACWGQW_15585 [bacterium]